MNTPNRVTLTRFFLYFIAITLLLYGRYGLAFAAGAAAAFGDILDGAVARRLGQTTKFGAALDFLTDKLLNTLAVVVLTFSDSISERFPIWVACAILSQAVFQIVVWLLSRMFAAQVDDVQTPRTNSGRVVFVVQTGAIGLVVLQNLPAVNIPLFEPTLWAVGGITVASVAWEAFIEDHSALGIE